jgi:hypothetical protein
MPQEMAFLIFFHKNSEKSTEYRVQSTTAVRFDIANGVVRGSDSPHNKTPKEPPLCNSNAKRKVSSVNVRLSFP